MNKITLEDILDNIEDEFYFSALDGIIGADSVRAYRHLKGDVLLPEGLHLLTICVLVLKNGYKLLGESACVDPENYNFEIGKENAKKDAISKIWPLMGYELKSKLQFDTI